jgi:branched-chain amino acid transport system ATP-binding protein
VTTTIAPAALQLEGVHASYGRVDVVHGVDLEVRRGEVLALLGPNGAGKSTTLKVAAGLHPATQGAVRVAGHRVNGIDPRALARLGVCMVPEGHGVFPNLTVSENLWLVTHVGIDRHHVEAIAFEHFPDLASRRHQLAGTLSGGEQQMLALARALAVDPVVLLIDELSMGLAPIVVASLYELVARLVATGVAVLAVEQFARAVLPIADRVAVMVNGNIAASGTTGEIEAHVADFYIGG